MASLPLVKIDPPGRYVELDGEVLFLGRDSRLAALIPSLTEKVVSTRHSVVRHHGRQWILEDLGSTNGTWLNGVAVTERVALRTGDVFVLGEGGPGVTCVAGFGAASKEMATRVEPPGGSRRATKMKVVDLSEVRTELIAPVAEERRAEAHAGPGDGAARHPSGRRVGGRDGHLPRRLLPRDGEVGDRLPRRVSGTARSRNVSRMLVIVSTVRAGSSPIRRTTPRMLTVSASMSGSDKSCGRTCSSSSPRPTTRDRPADSASSTLAPWSAVNDSVSRAGVTLNSCVTRGGATSWSCTHCVPERAANANRPTVPTRRPAAPPVATVRIRSAAAISPVPRSRSVSRRARDTRRHDRTYRRPARADRLDLRTLLGCGRRQRQEMCGPEL